MTNDLKFTQNFLHSKALVSKIIDLSKIKTGDVVFEIGPGDGIITRQLIEKVGSKGKVIAVELDAQLTEKLRTDFGGLPHVEIMQADILQFDLSQFPSNYYIFSNIPFNITSELLEHLFQPMSGPIQAHLILQNEVIIGVNKLGIETETFKSLLIKPIYDIELVYRFSKSDFVPQPGVDTGLFSFKQRVSPLFPPSQYELYKDFLAFVSKDRVGEGVWMKLFSKPQLQKITENSELVFGRGIKSQSIQAVISAFDGFLTLHPARQKSVEGAMLNLRNEQKHRAQINKQGGHHRSKANKKPHRSKR